MTGSELGMYLIVQRLTVMVISVRRFSVNIDFRFHRFHAVLSCSFILSKLYTPVYLFFTVFMFFLVWFSAQGTL